jgi:hypothetical protein
VQKISLVPGYRSKYGIVGAGAVSKSLIGQLPGKALGPVSAVSYRVASRIANTLRAGNPVRSAEELNSAPTVLFYSPPDQMESLLESIEPALIDWTDKPLIFCDCVPGRAAIERLRARDVSIAVARRFELPDYLIVSGTAPALTTAHRIARELHLKAIEIPAGKAGVFDAAVTLGTSALTPLIDSAAAYLREAGVRDLDAPRLAAALFQQTAGEYAHSGKQSWGWYTRQPLPDDLEAQVQAAGTQLGPVLRQMLLYGFELFGKHDGVAEALRVDANDGCTGEIRHKSPA